jgi:hypothetical protein
VSSISKVFIVQGKERTNVGVDLGRQLLLVIQNRCGISKTDAESLELVVCLRCFCCFACLCVRLYCLPDEEPDDDDEDDCCSNSANNTSNLRASPAV